MPISLENLSIRELMLTYRQINSELARREVCRTANSPTGDIAEYLFKEAFGWKLEPNSRTGFDAVCSRLGRVQIKSRFLNAESSSRQAGDIRQLDEAKFDWLAAVVFNPNAEIVLGLMIPHHVVVQQALKIAHTNSSRIYLRDDWLGFEGVYSVREQLTLTWEELNK